MLTLKSATLSCTSWMIYLPQKSRQKQQIKEMKMKMKMMTCDCKGGNCMVRLSSSSVHLPAHAVVVVQLIWLTCKTVRVDAMGLRQVVWASF